MEKSTAATTRNGEECYGRKKVAFRSCHTAAPSPRSSIGDASYDTGRWQSISVTFHRSSEIIHVVSVFSRANVGGETMVENANFMEQVFLEAGSLDSGSVFLFAVILM